MAYDGSRAKNAVIGSFAADAAAMPLHWIYDHSKINAILGEHITAPEFFGKPSCPFYDSARNPGTVKYSKLRTYACV